MDQKLLLAMPIDFLMNVTRQVLVLILVLSEEIWSTDYVKLEAGGTFADVKSCGIIQLFVEPDAPPFIREGGSRKS